MKPLSRNLRQGLILAALLVEFIVLALVVLAGLWSWWGWVPPASIGVLPSGVPLAGGLGGTGIAIAGLIAHWDDGTPFSHSRKPREGSPQKWVAWDFTRMPLGMLYGSIAVLIVVLFLRSVGVTDAKTIDTSPAGYATLFVVAFVVGYQADVFHTLLEAVISAIIGPGKNPAAPAPAAPAPAAPAGAHLVVVHPQVDLGTVAVGATATATITLHNIGSVAASIPVAAITVDPPSAGFTVTSASVPDIPPGQYGSIDVQFAPTVAQAGRATVTVSSPDAPEKPAAVLTGTGG